VGGLPNKLHGRVAGSPADAPVATMLEKITSDAPVRDAALALAALRWAADVGTAGPDASRDAPERPAPEEWHAVTVVQMREALDRLLLGRYTQEGLDALLHCGFLEAWMPEVHALVGFGDNEWKHKDIWKHTKQVVWQSVPRLAVRWSALLHDIGKVKTRRVEADGRVHFFGHSEVGAAMFRKRVARRLGFEGDFYRRVHFLILHHLRASQYDGSWTDSAVRRFAIEMDEGLQDLLDLSRADITTKRPERKKQGLRQISELSQRIERVRAEDAKPVPLPKGLGDAIMRHYALPPSRIVGILRNRLEAEVESGRLEAQRDDAYYLAWLDAHRAELDF
jgi:poly(A) polymerase